MLQKTNWALLSVEGDFDGYMTSYPEVLWRSRNETRGPYTALAHSSCQCSLMLIPYLPTEKGSGDNWTIPWGSSIDFKRTLFTCLHDVGPISFAYAHAWMTWHYFIGCPKSKTVALAQSRICSIVTRFLPSWEVGSGHKTAGKTNFSALLDWQAYSTLSGN